MEPECKLERLSLIKLLRSYKTIIKNISKDRLESDKMYKELKDAYIETEKVLLDKDLFYCYMGDHFESDCPPEKNTDDNSQ
jgi:hypothetical protein